MKTDSVKLKAFFLIGEPLHSERVSEIVLAPDMRTAISCMTNGSDSCWSEVKSCLFVREGYVSQKVLDRCYQNAGGFTGLPTAIDGSDAKVYFTEARPPISILEQQKE